MKAQTLKNRIKEHLSTKNGTLKISLKMIYEFIEKGGKFYGKKWRKNSGRWSLDDSKFYHLATALDKLQIDYITGNDSQRGGKENDYIELSAKGKRQTAELRKELRQQRLEREERQRQEREEAQRRESEAVEQYKKDCEQIYNYLRESANVVLTDEQKHVLNNYGKTNKAHKAICFELAKALHVQNNDGFRKYLYELAK
jgi:DNA-binding PadR family transcriptional regulator